MVPPCGGGGRRGEGCYHHVEEEGEGERVGAMVWRNREWGEGWCHCVEEGEGERGGTTVWRKREKGRGMVPPCGGRGRGLVPLCGVVPPCREAKLCGMVPPCSMSVA